MKSNFDACMAEIFRHEGGYVNDPQDPGGETNMGISRRSYPNEDIRGMTRARASAIYRRDFWNPVRGDELPAGLDLLAFDPAVNSGVSRGARWLQQALGVTADGRVGPQTLAAARQANPKAVIDRACDARLAWLRTLPTWGRFGRGWTSRVESIRSVATQMAGAPQSAPPVVTIPNISPPGKQTAGLVYIAAAIGAAALAFIFGR